MQTRPGFFRRHARTFSTLLFVFAYTITISYATPPLTPYTPGETLDPSCAPGTANCSTQLLPAQTGNTHQLLTTTGTTTAWTDTLTGTTISGSTNTLTNIPNSALTNASISINGSSIPLGGSVSNLATITDLHTAVSGTTNYIPKFSDTNTLTSSQIYDTGTNVGIGTSTPQSKLSVNGDIRIKAGSGGQIIFADGSTMSSSGLGSAAALSSANDAIITGDSDADTVGDVILKTGSNVRLQIANDGTITIPTFATGILHSSAGGVITSSIVTNGDLQNSSTTIGSTAISLGSSSTTLAGLTSITSTTFIGALTGNASTATTLATPRSIQGVSFNGSADINPINGTGFVKASGTTLSYDNSTYLTTSSAASTYVPLSRTINGYDLSANRSLTYTDVGAPSTTGTNASGTWGINISGNAGTATNATQWSGNTYTGGAYASSPTFILGFDGTNWRSTTAAGVQSFLGLGSNAYSSTAYLPLSAGSSYPLTGTLYVNTTTNFLDVSPTTGTHENYSRIHNTGADLYWGIGSNGANSIFSNQSAYSAVFGTSNATNLEFATSNAVRYTIDASGNNTWTGSGTFGNGNYIGLLRSGNLYGVGFYSNTAGDLVVGQGAAANPVQNTMLRIDGNTYAAEFAGNLKTSGLLIVDKAGGNSQISFNNNGSADWSLGTQVGDSTQNFSLYNYGTSSQSFSINKSNNNVFFYSTIVQASSAATLILNRTGGTTYGAGLQYQTSGTNNWILGTGQSTTGTDFQLYNYGTGSGALSIAYSTNALSVLTRSGTVPTYRGDLIINQSSNGISSNAGLEYFVDGSGNGYGWRTQAMFDGSSSYNYSFQNRTNSTTWTEKAYISSSGNLNVSGSGTFGGGITTSGVSYLNAVDGVESINTSGIRGASNSVEQLNLYDRVAIGFPSGWNTFPNAPGHGLLVNGSIISNGYVGIGTTNPVYELVVSNNGAEGFEINPIGAPNGGVELITYNRSTAAYKQLTLSASAFLFNGSTATFSSLGTGTVYSSGGTLTNTNPSDERIKNTINPLNYGLAQLLQLQPKSFYYNTDTDHQNITYGFIAQDVQQVLPELVRPLNDGTDHIGIVSDELVPIAIKAIQEMNIQVQAIPVFDDVTLYAKIADFLRGIAERGEAMVNKVTTHELCVDDVCVTRDQFLHMVQQNGTTNAGGSQQSGSTTESDQTGDTSGGEDTTTDSGADTTTPDAGAPTNDIATPDPETDTTTPTPDPSPTDGGTQESTDSGSTEGNSDTGTTTTP